MFNKVSYALRRRVSSMGGAERVVDINVRQLGELSCEFAVVLLFLSVKTQILEQQYLAWCMEPY